MTHRTRPTHFSLKLGLAALALLHACALAPRLRATQAAAPPAQTSADDAAPGDPVTKEWLLDALRARRLGEEEIVRLVEARHSSFIPTAEDEKELREAGATTRLLEAVRKSFRQGPVTRLGEPPPGGGGPGGGVDYSRPFKQNEVTRKALITFKPAPGFTEEARQNEVEGIVRLRAVLNASGKVTDIGVVKGLPDGLTEKAIAAAYQIKFRPAERDGRAVSQQVVLEYNFGLYLNEDGVDVPAVILEKPAAEYTDEARRNDTRGKVVLRVILTKSGSVSLHSVAERLPHGLTEKAVEAAGRIKFKPALLKSRPVSQLATVEYVFAP